MDEDFAPYLKPPFTFTNGRVASGNLEKSIESNIWLILQNHVQGIAKPKGVPADPNYGVALPHHEFEFGRTQDIVRNVRNAVRKLERRFELSNISFDQSVPGHYLPYSVIRIEGKVPSTGERLKLEFEIKE